MWNRKRDAKESEGCEGNRELCRTTEGCVLRRDTKVYLESQRDAEGNCEMPRATESYVEPQRDAEGNGGMPSATESYAEP